MEFRQLPAASGWHWVKSGFALFKQSAALWMALTMIGMFALMLIAGIPVVGEPLSTLLFPVIYGGLLLGCLAVEKNEALELGHLFAGFQHNAQQLVTLGGITLVAQLLILGLMKLTGGALLADLLMGGQPIDDPAIITRAIEAAGFSIFIGMALFVVLLLATQFAPMLILFGNVPPVQALKISLWLCLRNMAALSVYGIVMLSFAFLASLPVMLGWLVLLPLMMTSIYAAFREMVIFTPAPPEENADQDTPAS